MKEFSKRGKRLFVAFLSALLVITQLGIFSPVATYAAEEKGNDNQTAQVNATKAAARAAGDTVLTFTSDTHNNNQNAAANRMDGWLDKVQQKYGTVDAMGFCGDMGHYQANGSEWWGFVQNAMDVVTNHSIDGVYTTGNHEYMNGQYTSSLNNAAAKKYIISDLGKQGDNYIIYCLGSASQSESVTTDQISKLRSFLNSQGKDKPIIILVHFPLHWYSSRTTSNAGSVIDLLNEATDAGQKIVLLWGHNHTMSDSNYDQIFKPGSTIEYSRGNSKTIKFHYAAAGCMSGSEYSSGSEYVKGKGLVMTISSDDMLTMTYLDANGNDVTEGGTYSEDGSYVPSDDPVDPPTGDTVNITPTTDNPETSIKIAVGDTLTINTTNGSSSNAYDFTASLSNSSVAQIQGSSTVNIAAGGSGKFTVKGLTEGTVDVTIQNSNTYGSQYTRKGVVHVTVGEGGSTPVDPPTGDTVNITPSTDNPEQSIKIAVGDTLTINTTNGSTNSAYDFTATLSKSGVAEIQGNSTINIGTGSTGKFTVKGIANGTVDITIKNNSQYGDQYARKGVIHLTVGEGGGDTPVDPPTGDTVDITPSTDNPEQSIKINVGDTLTVNVTNGSTREAYDFTASLSKSGIAEIQGNATQNIATGASAPFTFKGLANGTVDITIKNNNSYGDQYARKCVIHLTVGEGGGDTPVDPPTGDSVDITPSTDHPEESIKIYVGDTFDINVKNGSSNSAYDFTATLSKSGIAEIQGNSTINIAMGATGTFTVKGLAAGTVDITIQNNSQYGDQYARKGIVHLTVAEGSAHDHEWDNGKETTAPTCTKDGVKTYTCSICGQTKTEAIKALGHDWEDKITEATCTEAGEKTSTCKRCGETSKETIPATGHKFSDWRTVTEPDCTKAGRKVRTCSSCGKNEFDDIAALGHDYKEVAGTAVEVTCTTDGREADQKCSRCDATITGGKIPALGHDFGEWTTVKEADCTHTGDRARSCKRCNEEEWDIISALGHDFGEWATIKEADCTHAGDKARSCKRCSKEEWDSIPALGHDYQAVEGTAKAASCTEAGKEADQKCSRCDDVQAGKEIPALGHDFGEWQIAREATATETGLKIRYCKRCKESEEETIPKTTPVNPTPDSGSKSDSKSQVPTTIPAEITPTNPVAATSVEKQILNAKTDADPKGSVFNLLQAKGVAKGKTSVKVSWKKVTGAKKYIIYGNKCGAANRFKKIKEVTGTSFTQKSLKKGTYYKYLIVAVNGKKALATSKGIHVATTGGKVGNGKSVTTKAKKNKVTLKKGKTFKLGAKEVAQSKKLKVKKHRAVAYESANKKIATVSAKGVIKGIKKGTCYVYAYAQNGVCKKIKVTVK